MGLISMLIVVPYISDNKTVYGVYAVCISISIFLSYTDLGFFSAGMKYAGESFARNNREEEYKLFGFAGFILFVFISLVALVYLIFSLVPSLLISDLYDTKNIKIASQLLLIQAIFSYNTLLMKIVDGVSGIRIEGYLTQKYIISGHILKIASIFYFFAGSNYDIVGFFLFTKIIDFLVAIIGLFIVKNRYNYQFQNLIKNFRFNKVVFSKTKSLAFGSFFVTILWIVYYELDTVVISKNLGPNEVAIFAVGFTFAKVLRSLTSLIFGPFNARYNHFVGLKDEKGLREFIIKVINFTMPLTIFTVISLSLLSKQIVLTWVGPNYSESIPIVILLLLPGVFFFINLPTDSLLVSLVRIKDIYKISITKVFVYWIGIAATVNFGGIVSFALFRFISEFIISIMYLNILLSILEIKFSLFIKNTIVKIIPSIIVQIFFIWSISGIIPVFQDLTNFGLVIFIAIINIGIGIATLYLISTGYRNIINQYSTKLLFNLKVLFGNQ